VGKRSLDPLTNPNLLTHAGPAQGYGYATRSTPELARGPTTALKVDDPRDRPKLLTGQSMLDLDPFG